jgi:hypothetical protein
MHNYPDIAEECAHILTIGIPSLIEYLYFTKGDEMEELIILKTFNFEPGANSGLKYNVLTSRLNPELIIQVKIYKMNTQDGIGSWEYQEDLNLRPLESTQEKPGLQQFVPMYPAPGKNIQTVEEACRKHYLRYKNSN